MRRCVALIPGWERLCSELNMERRSGRGTKGLGLPVEMSQVMVEFEVGIGCACHLSCVDECSFCNWRSSLSLS